MRKFAKPVRELAKQEELTRSKLHETECRLTHRPRAREDADALAAAELVGIALNGGKVVPRSASDQTDVASASARIDEEDMARLHKARIARRDVVGDPA